MNNSRQTSKEELVYNIFSSIAHRYDLLNTVLSFNRDKAWRRFAVKVSGLAPGGRGIDVACGTGMFAIEQARVVGTTGEVVGLDFNENMLEVARKNIAKTPYEKVIKLVHGNALDLPFPDNSFDAATIGFALRNVPDIEKTILEMKRVVKPGGRVINLELAHPTLPVFKQLYWFYFDKFVPFLGKLGVGMEGPYSYLPNSVKNFPHQQVIKKMFEDLGLVDVKCYELTGGIVAVHVGTKPN